MTNQATTTLELSSVTPDRTVRLFWYFLSGHVTFWTLFALLTQPNAPLDMIEEIYWGHHWQLGYYKHPPLPAWIAETVSQFTGRSLWAVYLASQLAVATTIWAAWRLAREVLSRWSALAAALALETCYYYNVTALDINNTAIVRPFWALSVLFLYWALTKEKTRYWVALGVCLGLGMMSKYYLAVLILAMFVLPLVSGRTRAVLRTRQPYLTLLVALAFFSPHLYWLVENGPMTVRYAFARAHSSGHWWDHLYNPVEFFLFQAGAFLPILFVISPITGFRWQLRRLEPGQHFDRTFLLVVVLGPLLLYMGISAVIGVHLLSMWGAPLWTFTAVLVMFLFESLHSDDAYRRVAKSTAVIGLIMAVGMTARNVGGPFLRKKPSRIHFPGAKLADEVERAWSKNHQGPVPIVAGPWWEVANAGFYLKQKNTIMYGDVDPITSPWSSDEELRRRGGVIVWQKDSRDGPFEVDWQSRFPGAIELPEASLSWQTSANLEPARIGLVVVSPQVVTPQAEPTRVGKKPNDVSRTR